MPHKTYDDIVRATIPEPDSSMRPSREQVARAYDGTHTRAHDELELYAAVQAALHSHPEGSNIAIDIRGDVIELRGRVKRPSSINAIEALVKAVPGVGGVTNKLIVAH